MIRVSVGDNIVIRWKFLDGICDLKEIEDGKSYRVIKSPHLPAGHVQLFDADQMWIMEGSVHIRFLDRIQAYNMGITDTIEQLEDAFDITKHGAEVNDIVFELLRGLHE